MPPARDGGAQQERFAEALTFFVQAAVSWHASVGSWPSEAQSTAKRLSREIGNDEYRSISQDNLHADLLHDFISVVQASPDES